MVTDNLLEAEEVEPEEAEVPEEDLPEADLEAEMLNNLNKKDPKLSLLLEEIPSQD